MPHLVKSEQRFNDATAQIVLEEMEPLMFC